MMAKWSDSFVEWEFYDDIEAEEHCGDLTMRWIPQNDWSKWDFRFDESIGDIRSQWPDRWDSWQMQVEGELITMKTRWPDDPSSWRISFRDKDYIMACEYPAIRQEWKMRTGNGSHLEWYTEMENDLGVWVYYEEGESHPWQLKLASAFIIMFSSVPHH